MEKRDLSNSWIPDMSGNYTAASFVWKDVTNSEIPLSNSLSIHIKVRQ
ncbi:MAG: hypothetical protein KGI27_09365 [Thaumarchaeota archaeon]|nr:hypothetical protein [Nitrososphaerota archaeon]